MSQARSARCIPEWLEAAATRFPQRSAVEDWRGTKITYRELADCSRLIAGTLAWDHGIQRGDRIGILMRKSVDTLITFQAVLRAGAAYVPLDPLSPVGRAALMLKDCEAKAVVVDEPLAEPLRNELAQLDVSIPILQIPGSSPPQCSWRVQALARVGSIDDVPIVPDAADLAFILYTSGSTGRPKGVMLTHENVVDFIDWCSQTFIPTEEDRFATHSPLHFSLPVFNVYVACKHGSTVCLLDEQATKVPQLLAPLIENLQITVWFSTPAVLALLLQFEQLHWADLSSLRLVMWGGEAMHTTTLQTLRARLPQCRLVHVLGSTETHIIAHYEIPPDLPVQELNPVPVGAVGGRFRTHIATDDPTDSDTPIEGELCLAGPGVTTGYWKATELLARVFFTDAQGLRWLRTGDIVRVRADGNLIYRGRQDRRVKKRGNRIELGEIEACLHARSGLKEVAVVAVPDTELGLKVQAYVVAELPRPSIIELKAHCARLLPGYMVPDTFAFTDALPRTSTGKIDYPRLKEMV